MLSTNFPWSYPPADPPITAGNTFISNKDEVFSLQDVLLNIELDDTDPVDEAAVIRAIRTSEHQPVEYGQSSTAIVRLEKLKGCGA